MIPHAWIQQQVFSLPLAELKRALGRKRLRIDRNHLVIYLVALLEQQRHMRHFKAIYGLESHGVGYAGFMKGVGLVAPLWRHLEIRYRAQHKIGFDQETLIDSSLMPAKEEANITRKDWDRGCATVRSKEGGKTRICGEKWLAVLNGKRQLVVSELMRSINDPDDHVLKNPMSWASRGLRHGNILADRGFGNNAVRQGLAFLRKTLPGYTARIISPPRKRQAWALTPDEISIYRRRWDIEEAFRQLNDPLGRFRLSMKGVRRSVIRQARVAIATLAWNMEHTAA
jgi:hypothetical protein